MKVVKEKKPKKEYKFFNVVLDETLLKEIHETKNDGYNWQALIRNFIKQKIKEIEEDKSSKAVESI
ncbi:MAG: hypothetical protein PHW29_04485 [Flavobacterium sp.]|nr:hypothetical protein [Flavobacterium sp.]